MAIQSTNLNMHRPLNASVTNPNNADSNFALQGKQGKQNTSHTMLDSEKVNKTDKQSQAQDTLKAQENMRAQKQQAEERSAKQDAEMQKQQLEKMVESLESFISSFNKRLAFRVENEIDQTVVSVYEVESGDLIKQIPNEDWIDLAKRMSEIIQSNSSSAVDESFSAGKTQSHISGTLFEKSV